MSVRVLCVRVRACACRCVCTERAAHLANSSFHSACFACTRSAVALPSPPAVCGVLLAAAVAVWAKSCNAYCGPHAAQRSTARCAVDGRAVHTAPPRRLSPRAPASARGRRTIPMMCFIWTTPTSAASAAVTTGGRVRHAAMAHAAMPPHVAGARWDAAYLRTYLALFGERREVRRNGVVDRKLARRHPCTAAARLAGLRARWM